MLHGRVHINKTIPLLGCSMFSLGDSFRVHASSESGLVVLVSLCNTSPSPTLLFCEGVLGLQPICLESMSSGWSTVLVLPSEVVRFIRVLQWTLLLLRSGSLSLALVLGKALKLRPADWCVCGIFGEGEIPDLSHSTVPPAVILRSLGPGKTLGTCSEYKLLV